MNQNPLSSARADCEGVDRRQFLKTSVLTGAAVAASFALPQILVMDSLQASPVKAAVKAASSETLVATLYKSLSAPQREAVAFEFHHPLRSKIDANWRITPQKIAEFFTSDQQAMIREIFLGVHNPEYADKVMQHLQEDGSGIGNYSIALFGQPGSSAFEFVLTGRHCTMRCDGDSVEGAAFGGPIFYGHAAGTFNEEPAHPGNVYWFQAKRANDVFQALDGTQRTLALLDDPRKEQSTATVELKRSGQLSGLPISEMSRDQKVLVEKALGDLLLPFRKKDADEAMRMIRKNGSLDQLHLSFYKNLDVGSDGIWDVWQLESPNMVWYFRGHPHVHVWVNIQT